MPHFIVEYTDNLAADGDIAGLLAKIAAKLGQSGGVFPIGGIRVRAIRLSEYVVADGANDGAFVHATARIGAGRSPEFKARFFGEVFDIIKAHFAELFARRDLALSLYVEEADEAASFKSNNMHERFAAGFGGLS